jgi:hypothetical protein
VQWQNSGESLLGNLLGKSDLPHQSPRRLRLDESRDATSQGSTQEINTGAPVSPRRGYVRIGMEKVPDAKTLVRLGQAIGPDAIRQLHDRMVAIAQEHQVVQGRKMRVDTTVVESNIRRLWKARHGSA